MTSDKPTPVSMSAVNVLPHPSVLAHITDAHCHPTDARDGVPTKSMERLQIKICAMSSMQLDQKKVKALANEFPDKVTPAFGHHPWFSHWISTESSLSPVYDDLQGLSDKERHYRNLFLPHNSTPTMESEFANLLSHLPDPIPLTVVINALRDDLLVFPNAMLGEVGLDRSFRVPLNFFASPRVLTSFHIPLDHQLEILEAQLAVAVEMERNISLHSVKSQLATLELFERMEKKWGEESWRKISIDMHSCGFSKPGWINLEKKHKNVFMSLSTVINNKHSKVQELIATCSPDRILAESDYNDIDMVTTQTWDMLKFIADVRGWPLEMEWKDDLELEEKDWGVVRRLERNWNKFKAGNHPVETNRRNKKVVIDKASAGGEM